MNHNANNLTWFEIPVSDIKRARHFYQLIFSIHMEVAEVKGIKMAFFPTEKGNGKVSGALVKGPYHHPSMTGPLIYLNADPDLEAVLKKVESAGGMVLLPKTEINPFSGFMALIVDTEGNRLALHGSAPVYHEGYKA